MRSGTVQIQVKQGAGYCLDLFLGITALYQKKISIPGCSKRLENSLQYLREELGEPDPRLAAVFCHSQSAVLIVRRFAPLIFGRTGLDRFYRELSISNPVSLLEELIDLWMGKPSDPSIPPEERDGYSALPHQVQFSLSELYKEPSVLLTGSIDLLRRMDNRMKVVYQTYREDLAEFQMAVECKKISWNESGMMNMVDRAENMPSQEHQTWYSAVSLLAENRLAFLGSLEDKILMVMGVETMERLDGLSQDEPAEETDNLPVLLRALADPIRLKILDILTQSRCYTGELGRKMGIAVPALLYHLNLLKEAGFIYSQPEGRKMYYAMNDGSFAQLIGQLKKRYDCSEPEKGKTV